MNENLRMVFGDREGCNLPAERIQDIYRAPPRLSIPSVNEGGNSTCFKVVLRLNGNGQQTLDTASGNGKISIQCPYYFLFHFQHYSHMASNSWINSGTKLEELAICLGQYGSIVYNYSFSVPVM